MVPVDVFYLWPTLEDASQTPLTGRGCHGPSGPYYGRPGEQTRTTTLNRFIYLLKSAATAVDYHACTPLCLVLLVSLFGPVHPFFARPHPPLSPLARLQACTYRLALFVA